ncbi:DEAD/DEAH box helicase [Herbiconiux sp. CPCC 203407]|uniref:DEAD/DEAH box helicase n=1 Tax=Herbiconiux oxytropis TaxID=2970915 RepID=A0AA41XHI1_9MICO|nr:DEAD/DEAH box helicase [Herbiconiux oxytropis]MCS5724005.1 DEAD/DEAH box helicase [Herbiconiux oxytropis]MCS5726583.1 DEAD/DEAH box helicase [Herbiconiux oxytropis]
MPKNNKSGGFKPAKNYEPRTPGKGGPKAGSRSPSHRGYRPESDESPRKQRWSADDRSARGAAPSSRGTDRPERGGYGDRPERGGYRGNDRSERSERPSYGDRPARGGYGDRPARGGYGDRPERGGFRGNDRSDRNDRSERPSYGDRPERGSYGDRPARGGYERPNRENGFNKSGTGTGRSERPAYERGDRGERPAYNRGERPSYERGERPAYNRDERPAYGRDERGGRGGAPARTDRQKWNDARNEERRAAVAAERAAGKTGKAPRVDENGFNRSTRPEKDFRPAERTERPKRSWDRDDRAPRTNDYQRPSVDRTERPSRSFDDRPKRSFDRDDRAPRTSGYDRPARRDDDRPARSFDDRPKRSFDRDDRASGADRADRSSNFYPSRDSKPVYGSNHGDDDVVLERLEATATLAEEVEGVSFGDLGLGGNIVKVLAELGAESPFPIQAATIPMVLQGKDVLGRGRTGSGKTIAFGAPLVERLLENGGGANRKPGRKPRALILAPTRELALQIDRTVQPIARSVGLFTTQIYGGVSQHRQVGALQRGVDIIIGTPGRIEDLIEQRRLDLSEVTITVLDEADHMCDLGFLEPVQRILRRTKDGGQKLLFSATLDKGVAKLVEEFLVEPSVHEVAGEDQASSTIDHRVLIVESRDKSDVIKQLADREGKTLIFSRTRAYAEMLAEQLEDAGFPATSLHGDLNQAKRTRNLQMLTSGRVNVLVATDVAARGIHVDDIDLVIQADAPDEYKTYLHRAGRTGRAGKKGTVVTLIGRSRGRRMHELLGRAEIEAEMVTVVPGDEILRDISADTDVTSQGTK